MPLLPTVAMGALPIAEFGTPEQRAAGCPASSRARRSSPRRSPRSDRAPSPRVSTAAPTATGWRLDGTAVERARRPSCGPRAGAGPLPDGGQGVFIVDPAGAGVGRRAGRDHRPADRRPPHVRRRARSPEDVLGTPATATTAPSVDPRPGRGGAVRHPAGRGRGGTQDGGRVHRRTVISSAGRCRPSRGPPSRRPTPTSTPRPCGPPCGRRPGGSIAGNGRRRRRSRSPSGGRPRPANGWSTPPSTCTAGLGADVDYPDPPVLPLGQADRGDAGWRQPQLARLGRDIAGGHQMTAATTLAYRRRERRRDVLPELVDPAHPHAHRRHRHRQPRLPGRPPRSRPGRQSAGRRTSS